MHPQRLFQQFCLDHSFVKCFAPIHNIQAVLGSSRTNIKNNVVTSVTAKQKLYTFIWIICFTASFTYFECFYYQEYHHKSAILYVTSVIGLFVQYISYVSNIIHVRFSSSTSSTEMYVMIQKIDDILLLKQYNNLTHNQFYWNIVFLIVIVVSFECGFITYMVLIIDYPIFTIFWAAGLLITYLDLLLTGSLIYYVTIRLKYLNKIIQYNIIAKYCCKDPPANVNQKLIVSTTNTGDTENLNLNNFLLSLKQILRCYSKITEVFSFTVFNVAATSFLWTLVIIEAMFVGLRDQLIPHISIICFCLWIAYYFFLVSTLAVVNDIFMQEVRRTKLYCTHAMSYYFEGPIREGANDILRAIQFMEPVFSVYGIFILDKSLIFKLIGIITTNVVILIQFTM